MGEENRVSGENNCLLANDKLYHTKMCPEWDPTLSSERGFDPKYVL